MATTTFAYASAELAIFDRQADAQERIATALEAIDTKLGLIDAKLGLIDTKLSDIDGRLDRQATASEGLLTRAETENLGLFMRGAGLEGRLSRAATVVALRETERLEDVKDEIASPTSLE